MEQNESLKDLLKEINFKITKLSSNGELAQLKRQNPDEPPPPAFYRIAMPSLENYKFYPTADEKKAIVFEKNLMVLLCAMASDNYMFNPSVPLGVALSNAGFPELRFYRLLKANEAALRKQVSYMCKYLSSKGVSGNISEAFELMKSQDASEAAQIVRRKISRDYYRSQAFNNISEENKNA